jgi:hypothetical protein
MKVCGKSASRAWLELIDGRAAEVDLVARDLPRTPFNHRPTYYVPVRRDIAQEHIIDVDRHADADLSVKFPDEINRLSYAGEDAATKRAKSARAESGSGVPTTAAATVGRSSQAASGASANTCATPRSRRRMISAWTSA